MSGKLLFIGAGNMGQAIIKGIIQSGLFQSQNIGIYEPDHATRERVVKEYQVKQVDSVVDALKTYTTLVLAVKPQVFHSFSAIPEMADLQKIAGNGHTIISIMAGVSIEKINSFFCNTRQIIRVMPNTPALIGKGMSVISHPAYVTEECIELVKKIFASIGEIEILDEKYIDAVTGLSGSGPAFVMAFIEALTQGGILCGLSKPVSEKLAIQTVAGSALMASESVKSVEELRHMVTSPGGTTIHGVAALEENGFRNSVIKAVSAAYGRSKDLSKS